MHEICKQVYHIPATVGCNDLVPFIIPTSWMTRMWMQPCYGREPPRGTVQGCAHFLCSIYWVTFTQCFTKGWAEVSCWDASCRASDVILGYIILCSLFEVQHRHKSIHNITFSFQTKPWMIFIFHVPTCDLVDVSLSMSGSVSWPRLGGYIRPILIEGGVLEMGQGCCKIYFDFAFTARCQYCFIT